MKMKLFTAFGILILGYGLGYLVSVGIVKLLFVLVEKTGNVTIDYNVWFGGILFYIIWLLFWKKS